MTANRQVPCQPYITHEELASCCNGVEAGGDGANTLLSRQWASEFLFYRTAKQYPGTCVETIRPCYACAPCGNPNDVTPPWTPHLIQGRTYNVKCTGSHCTCSDASYIDLPDSPVTQIREVKIDGVVLAADQYALHNDTLYRREGASWPYCNELFLPDTEVGTWSVQYEFGHIAPGLLKRAAIALACHWQKMCNGDDCNACEIPRSVTAMQRGGTSYQMMSTAAMQAITGNLLYTGIEEVDDAIQTLNPMGYRRMARIYD